MPVRNDDATEALLARAAQGDAEAAGQAVSAFDARLRKAVELRLDPRVARRVGVEDVLQETRVEALRRLPEYLAAREVPLVVWLRYLALQRCVTLVRRHLAAGVRDVRREQGLGAAAGPDDTSLALENALAASLTSPSGAAVRAESRTQLRAAVAGLEPLDREILCLRHFEGLDNAEAAAALGLESGTASKRYVRALVRLREVLADVGLGPSAVG